MGLNTLFHIIYSPLKTVCRKNHQFLKGLMIYFCKFPFRIFFLTPSAKP